MALLSRQEAIGNTAELLVDPKNGTVHNPYSVVIKNIHATNDAFLGPSDVTILTGLTISPGEFISFDLEEQDQIFAIAAVASSLAVFELGI